MKNSEFIFDRKDVFEMQKKFANPSSSQEQIDHTNITHIYSYESSEDFDEQDNKTPPKNCCPELNRKLIVYKTFYFLFFGAVGALFPYLAVFYKQLWLSAHQVGILIGLRPFIQMCASPLWGVLADTYNVSKMIFLMSIGAWLVSNFSISMVKPKEYEPTCDLNLTFLPLSDYMDEEEVHWPRIDSLLSKKDNITYPDKNKHNNNNVYLDYDEKMIDRAAGEPNEPSSLFAKGNDKSFNNSNNKYGRENITRSFHNASENKHGSSRNRSRTIKLLRTMFGVRRRLSRTGQSKTVRKNRNLPRVSSIWPKLDTSDEGVEKMQRNSQKEVKYKVDRRKRGNSGENYKDNLEPEEYLEEMTNQNVNGGFYENSLLPNQRVLANEDLKEEFDSLKTPNGMFWPLDDKIDITNATESQSASQIKEAHNLFKILIVITICGTILSSPAATLADTATLQALGEYLFHFAASHHIVSHTIALHSVDLYCLSLPLIIIN